MKIVTTNYNLHNRFSIEKTIEMISQAGFDGIDFSDIPVESEVWEKTYQKYAKHIRNVADNFGIVFSQTHSPIIGSVLRAYNQDKQFAIDRIRRSIEFSALIGAEHVVIHPIQNPKYATDSERVFEENMNYISQLIPCAEDCHIKIAIENMVMPTLDGARQRDGVCADPEEFKRYIDALDSKCITGCLDFGHCAISGREAQDMLRAMGADYITSVHIHDNDFIKDCHQLPCTMKMNWEEICKAMAEVGYRGDFTLEAVNFWNGYSDEFIPEALHFMYQTSKYLVDKIKKYNV